jgi:thiol-disulfide isomerase/thioredoxin
MVLAALAGCAGSEAAPPPSSAAGAPPVRPPRPVAAGPSTAPASVQLAEMGYHGDDAAARARPDPASCPGAADGRELIGAQLGEWQLADWAGTAGAAPTLASLRGRVVVVRFWTTGCPHCEKTLPALQKLSQELRDLPVTFIGAFHGKPASSEPDLERPLRVARSWGVTFPLALDREWRTLRAWWLDGAHRHATSVTFVIGKDGRVVHVHPGPVFYPTDDPDLAEVNRDHVALRRAVVAAAGR